MKQTLHVLCLLGTVFSSLAANAEIVSSIKPVHLIVREIAKDQLESSSLLDGSASPHDYSMKVSDAQKLRNADTFVWIGPQMEGFLSKAVARFVDPKNEIRLSNGFDVHSLAIYKKESNAEEDHADNTHGDGAHSHDDSWHLWLSYRNAGRMAEMIASHLINKDPSLAEQVQENLQQFMQRLGEQRIATEQAFVEYSGKGFFAYHDAYQSYVEEFELKQLESAKLIPGSQLSLKRMMKLKEIAPSAACMLANSEELSQAESLAAKLDLPVIGVDLLAASEGARQSDYDFFHYMIDIRASFLRCFMAS